jgi:hypothetical protein
MSIEFVQATSADGRKLRINLGNVALLAEYDNFTRVAFVGATHIDVNEKIGKLLPSRTTGAKT